MHTDDFGAIVARAHAVIDEDVEYFDVDLADPPDKPDAARAATNAALRTLYDRNLIPLDIPDEHRGTATSIREYVSEFPRARVRVEAVVHETGECFVTVTRIGGPWDNVKPGEGMLFHRRVVGLLAAAVLERLEG